jgi:hypothetical protein
MMKEISAKKISRGWLCIFYVPALVFQLNFVEPVPIDIGITTLERFVLY